MTAVGPLDLSDTETLEALVRLQRAAYAVEAELIGSDAIPALHEDGAALAARGERTLGVRDDGELVGAVGWTRDGDVVDVHRLVVAPSAFRRGIASLLLDALDAAEPDATRTLVSTGSANAPALALYARRGFAVRGEREVAPGLRVTDLERPRGLIAGSPGAG